jgi:hypothetical protein
MAIETNKTAAVVVRMVEGNSSQRWIVSAHIWPGERCRKLSASVAAEAGTTA